MYPEPLFYVYGTGITGYTLAFTGGVLPALFVLLFLGQERGLNLRAVLEAAVLSGGLALAVGSLLTLGLQWYIGDFPARWSLLFILMMVGSVLLYFWRMPATRSHPGIGADIFFPALALYLSIARIGCLMSGGAHGKPAWGVPWAIIADNPASATAYRGIPIHPTQIYQIVANLLVFIVLMALRNRPGFQGRLVWVYLILYGIGRFVVEIYRGDPRPMAGPLSLNQIVCLLFIAVGVAGWRGWLPHSLWTGLGQRLRLIPHPVGS